MNIAIRVDGSLFIGMGHVMRMLALAEAMQQSGHVVEFFSRFEPGLSRIRAQGFIAHQVIGGLPDGPDKEYEPAGDTEAVCQLLSNSRFDCLVTDSYRIDTDYFRQVRPLVKSSFYIDDLNRFPVEVDAVFNGNINAAGLGYDSWPQSVQRWLGCNYNLLRPEFADLPERTTPNKVKNLLIVAGGGDAGKLLVFLAKGLLDLVQTEQVLLHLVAPTWSAADSELAELAGSYPEQVRIHRAVTEMAKLMQQCDLAISAGGTTLYELCAVGVPRLAVVLASNQQAIVEAMVRQGLAVSLGAVEGLTATALVAAISRMLQDREQRAGQSCRGRSLVDGKGVLRVAQTMENRVATAERSAGQ